VAGGALISALGLLSALAGLPLWISAGIALTAIATGAWVYGSGRVPDAPLEILLIAVMGLVLVLAVRGAADLLSGGKGHFYRYFATEPVVVSHIVPWSKAVAGESFSEGAEIHVVCRTEGVKNKREVWLRLPNGTYVADADTYQDYSDETLPKRC
jgi:hypothetical protein